MNGFYDGLVKIFAIGLVMVFMVAALGYVFLMLLNVGSTAPTTSQSVGPNIFSDIVNVSDKKVVVQGLDHKYVITDWPSQHFSIRG